MSAFKTIDDLDVAGKRVLVRADLNMPMKDGRITDASRMEKTLPTLNDLLDRGAGIIVMSHLGRPGGQVVAELSLAPVAQTLTETLGRDVSFAADCIGPEAEKAVETVSEGGVAMLENLRFHSEEEANDVVFAGKLAELGHLYVNDAFSCAHRAHASIEAIAHLLPSAAGRLMAAELDAFGQVLESPQHPIAAVVGGAKISTKMAVLGHLVERVDLMIIGGAMANTFLNVQGFDVGRSLCEPDMAETAKTIIAKGIEAGCEVALPLDAVVAKEFAEGVESETVLLDAIPADSMILDLGPATVADLLGRLQDYKTLIWNGPLGAFEIKPFDFATNALARKVAELTADGGLLSIAGGGDTVAALVNAEVSDQFSYVSMAGGAFLEWLEGKELPGVAALKASS
jgi:phosphoglycerate kinase